MIVDTSVLAAALFDEPERPRFFEILSLAQKSLISAGSWIELTTVLARRGRRDLLPLADRLRANFAIGVAPVTEAQAELGRAAYLEFGKGSGNRARLNFGDCFAYALARETGRPLLFKGDDFIHTDIEPVIRADPTGVAHAPSHIPRDTIRNTAMATDLHDIIAPVLTRGLANLAALLHKGEVHAASGAASADDLLGARLIADMHPLVRQVQMVSDSAKGAMARLAGVDVPAMPDEEASFADLQQRIEKTLDFVRSIPADAVNGKEDSEIVLTFPNGEFRFTAIDYVRGFVLPNFFFHLTTAYALLRAQGVPIGKRDFLGG